MIDGAENHLLGARDGQTPLDPDEADQVLPAWVTTRGDLDAAEQRNIADAIVWLRGLAIDEEGVLHEPFLHQLHRRMFGDVWRWAGAYRTTARNLGVDPWLITEHVAALLGDARYWVANAVYLPDEIGVRFHHRLVAIHPFPNGNGRHARLAADLLVQTLGRLPFSWGISRAHDPKTVRQTYISSLRRADAGDIGPLLAFART